MDWTPAKLRYLLAFHSLSQDSETVRCIDLAVHLGISRASVSRMLAQLSDDGVLEQAKNGGFLLTELGKSCSDHYFSQYESLYQLFRDRLNLSDFDAGECASTLITSLPSNIVENLSSKAEGFLLTQA